MERNEGGLTRRGVLAGAGALATAGAVAPAAAAAHVRRLGEPRHGRPAAEAVGELAQDGDGLTGYGYITHLAGLGHDALLTGEPLSESTARLTFFAQATVRERFPHGVLVAVIGTGTLSIHLHEGGADFASPGSFAAGPAIARFAARFQHVATVFAPNQAISRIEGDLTQRHARGFELGGRRNQLGRRGLRMHMTASGQGHRTQPVPPQAIFDVAARFDVVR
jgi:hypothetical protein